MVQASYHRAFVFVLLGITQLAIVSKAKKETWTCEEDWTPFTAKGDIYCLTPRSQKRSMQDAHSDCVSLNASLISIHSKEKDDFVQALMGKQHDYSILIGLTFIREPTYNAMGWLRRDGNEKMDYTNFYSRPSFGGSTFCTLKLEGLGGTWDVDSCTYRSRYPYYCEKRPVCGAGTFGGRCEKQCHCHGQLCEPGDLTGFCPSGCKRGWMGIACDKRKESADVSYYCVNSKDHGTYVSIMINTKGVEYRNIHGQDVHGKQAPWCNDTSMIIGRPKGYVNIQIFKTEASQEGLNAGVCAGKVIDENTYEWTLVIQERKGILMDRDQSLSISCNFTKAETLSREGHADVREKTGTPVINLQETHEDVKLEVADASTGQALTQIKPGSPVRLQIRFGQKQGSIIKGIVPYNCKALSDDGKQSQPLLDKFGCQETDLVSPFHKTDDSHAIQTEWFPAFGFEGSSTVQLQCSFTFCFVECQTGCDEFGHNSSHTHKRTRFGRDTYSHRDVHHSVLTRIAIISAPDA